MAWRGRMTTPAGISDPLDLPVDPQLVHDLAKTLNAGVGDKRKKFLRFVLQTRFHSIEDEYGVFAQGKHGSPLYDWRVGVLVGYRRAGSSRFGNLATIV